MGIIKEIWRVLLAFGTPLIPVIIIWTILGPATFWQTLASMIVCSFVYIVAGCVTVTLVSEG